MLFEKDKYYKYIKELENIVNFSYAIYAIIFGILGAIIGKGIGLILGIIIGMLLARAYTLNTKIKIQKMKWEIDIHQKIYKL